MNQKNVHVGIDVSKELLDLTSFDKKVAHVPNTKRGIRSLIERIKKFPQPIIVCCESSGGYEKLLVTMLLEAEIPIARVNAKRVRDYAKSQGILAKTDAIDAHVIALYSKSSSPRLLSSPPEWVDKIKALLLRRNNLTEIIKQEKNRGRLIDDKEAISLLQSHLKFMKKQLDKIDDLLANAIANNDQLKQHFKRITEVKSIGKISALSLLAFIPELGTITDNAAAALAGLAPYNDDSGTKNGKRFIQGGRAHIREPLYMAALSAKTYNQTWSLLYNHLIEKGKPHKVALTAIMRKMVVLANRLIADPTFKIS